MPPNDPQYLRNRAYSAPTKAPPSSRFIPDAEPTTLWGEQVLRHKRKKSSISTSNHRNRTPIAAQDDLSPYEVAFIQKNAMQRRERLNVLSLNSVEKYSQELFELNERYEYIRESRNSARQSRRTLHSKMITYLKTTPSRMFSQDCILGQEEALADLDIEIEDWDDKLEKVIRSVLFSRPRANCVD